MKRARRRLVVGGGALALAFGVVRGARAAGIVAVRVWPADEYTRVTIESDAALEAKHFVTGGPARLVVDVDGLDLSPALKALVGKVRGDDPFLAGVRVGQNQPRTVRLVFDLKKPTLPQVFSLAPVAAYRHRLVFDLYPVQPTDPLLELIRGKEAAEHEAAQSVQDALGEWIGRMDAGKPQPVPSAGQGATLPSPSLPPAVPPVAAAPPAAPPQQPQPSPGGPTLAQRPPSPQPGGPTLSAPSLPPETAAVTPPPAVAAAPPHPARRPPPSLPPAEQRRIDRLIVVAIDPGHGGEDPGAIGPSGLREKDVVLAIGLQLRDRLNAIPNVRAMMTRDADFFVPLHQRVAKARRVQADLFVSLHADAFLTPEARGASVFALSERGATSSAARWMADRENAADLVGGVNFRPGDVGVLRAMLDMSTTAQIKDSLKLGNEVLGRIGRVGKLHKGSVEQASFAVLKAPDVPSILVETAFISNPEEEAKLRDPGYQQQLVEAVATGIQRYFARNPPLARNRTL